MIQMGLPLLQLEIEKRNTKRFIDSDPTKIVLIPRLELMNNGTKISVEGNARPAQNFRVIWDGDDGIIRPVNSDGGVRRFKFVLIGMPDAKVEINDSWISESQLFVVEYKFPSLGYSVKVGGTSHGSVPTG